ncbi:hypothetical protein F5Y14DRAFT_465367 [Nemania sp. NC0429]|nr:hypothetical protein F5Y14DRAFT_465367 [Nemania sp. NC0429]
MSDTRRVTFSPSPPLKGVLKHPEPHARDSGVGSSSSDYTSSSGSLDEKFTARDYDIQSNNVDALREALAAAIKDIDQWKAKCTKKSNELADTRKTHRQTDTLYREALEREETLQAKVESLADRMEKQDVALGIANIKIAELESEVDDWEEKYRNLDDLYETMRHSGATSIVSSSSGDHSLSFGLTRSQREKDSAEMSSRLKERINRDQTDSSSHTTQGSRSSNTAANSKRSSQRTGTSANSSKPYIEKLPKIGEQSRRPRRHLREDTRLCLAPATVSMEIISLTPFPIPTTPDARLDRGMDINHHTIEDDKDDDDDYDDDDDGQ